MYSAFPMTHVIKTLDKHKRRGLFIQSRAGGADFPLGVASVPLTTAHHSHTIHHSHFVCFSFLLPPAWGATPHFGINMIQITFRS